MTLPHLFNLLVHVLAGALAMTLGVFVIQTQHDWLKHRSRGLAYIGLTSVVCLTAVIGNLVFRFMPLFAVLTLLVSYQLFSGWHVIHTRTTGPNAVDAVLLLGGITVTALLATHLVRAGTVVHTPASVMVATFSGVLIVLIYDALRWTFPTRWHATLWRYEHIYKIVGSLFAMLSAAVGNTVRFGQPWSQLVPSAIGIAVIIWCWVRNYRAQRGIAVPT